MVSRIIKSTMLTVLAGVVVMFSGAAQGAPATWDGSIDNAWDAISGGDSNWTGGLGANGRLASGDSAIFATGGGNLNNNLTDGSFNIAGITFSSGAPAFVIGNGTLTPNVGNTFALTGDVTNNSTSLQTINNPFSMTAVRTFTTTVGGGDITLSGVINGSGGGLTKSGAGILTLNAVNGYTGTTSIRGGTLALGADNALGPGPVDLRGGGILALGSYNATVTSVTKLGNEGGASITGSGILTATSTAANAFSIANTGGDGPITIDPILAGPGGLTKAGGSTLTLNGLNTYGGPTTINAGALIAGTLADGNSNSSIGASSNAAANLVFSGGGVLRYTGGTVSTNRLFSLSNGASGGELEASGSGTVNFTNAGAMGFVGSGNRLLTLSGTNAGDNTLATLIGDGAGGATSLTKSAVSVGKWVLTNANTYTGVTTIGGGVLSVSSLANGGSPSNIGQATNAAANLVLGAGTLQYTGSGATSGTTDRGMTLNDAAGLRGLNASGAAGSPMVFNNNARLIATGGQNGNEVQLVFTGSNTDDNTFASAITQPRNHTTSGGRTTSVRKSGTGTWVLSGDNVYRNITTIDGGVLKVTKLSATQPLTMNVTTTLGSPTVTVASTTGLIVGMAIDSSQSASTDGRIPAGRTIASIDSATQFTLDDGTGVTAGTNLGTTFGFGDALGWAPSAATHLVLNGGTLAYVGSGATNGTTHRLFTLGLGTTAGALDASGAPGSPFVLQNTGPMAFTGTGTRTLTLTGTNTDANTLAAVIGNQAANATSLAKSGSGTWGLTGINTYTGGTTISDGTLLANTAVAGTNSATGTGAITATAGGTLGGAGQITPTGTNGISVAGLIAPGASIGTLTFNLGSTTGKVSMLSDSGFEFELGAPNASIGSIAPGSSDLLVILNAAAGDMEFNDNIIDFLGTASGSGYYKLFDTSLGSTTWTGLTLGGSTVGGNFITGGLSISNLGAGFAGDLILANGNDDTSAGDIYLSMQEFSAVPEPSTFILTGIGLVGLGLIARRRRK